MNVYVNVYVCIYKSVVKHINIISTHRKRRKVKCNSCTNVNFSLGSLCYEAYNLWNTLLYHMNTFWNSPKSNFFYFQNYHLKSYNRRANLSSVPLDVTAEYRQQLIALIFFTASWIISSRNNKKCYIGLPLDRNPCLISTLSALHERHKKQVVQTDSWIIRSYLQSELEECSNFKRDV
jgi:hypothetical protein